MLSTAMKSGKREEPPKERSDSFRSMFIIIIIIARDGRKDGVCALYYKKKKHTVYFQMYHKPKQWEKKNSPESIETPRRIIQLMDIMLDGVFGKMTPQCTTRCF